MKPTPGPLKVGVILHDAEIIAVRHEGKALVIEIKAEVYRSPGIPGVDASTVWGQTVRMTLGNGQLTVALPEVLEPIYKGGISVGSHTFTWMVPCPFDAEGDTTIELMFCTGEESQIVGDRLTIVFTDEPEYLYDIKGSKGSEYDLKEWPYPSE